jgi:hypothetical protein
VVQPDWHRNTLWRRKPICLGRLWYPRRMMLLSG